MTETRDVRLFVAVPLGDQLRSSLAKAMRDLRAASGSAAEWRWTAAEDWHLTLAFIGWTDPDAVSGLARAIGTAVAGNPPFRLECGRLGTFPGHGAARVLWYGVSDPDQRLAALARDISEATGADHNRVFNAHLTLARSRDRWGSELDPTWATATLPMGELWVDRVILYQTHLERGPLRYQALAEVSLPAPLLTEVDT